MPDREQLIEALAQLDPAAFEDVVTSAFRRRHPPGEAASPDAPDSRATPQQFAHWLANRHLSSDAAIEQVVYLPDGSPAGEIRLLEVNRFLDAPEPDVVEPLDFTPDTDPPFRVFVADITSDQWDRIKRAPESLLPKGWNLKEYQIIGRK
jgi:hypothetical protein